MHPVSVFVVALIPLSAGGCNASSHSCSCICCLGSIYYCEQALCYISCQVFDCQVVYAVPTDNLDHLGLLYAACNTLDSGRQLVQQGEHSSSVHRTASPGLLARICTGVVGGGDGFVCMCLCATVQPSVISYTCSLKPLL